jgi:hypothetical protein
MEVIVMKVVWKEGGPVVAGVVGAGEGPLAGDGLDEALGLAVGLRAIGFGEEMADAQLLAGSGEEFGAVSRAAVGEHPPDLDAVLLVKGDRLLKRREHVGDLFIRGKGSKGEAAVIVDGDMQAFHAGAAVAEGFFTRGPDAGLLEAAEFLD